MMTESESESEYDPFFAYVAMLNITRVLTFIRWWSVAL